MLSLGGLSHGNNILLLFQRTCEFMLFLARENVQSGCMLMECMQFQGWQVSTLVHANKWPRWAVRGVLLHSSRFSEPDISSDLCKRYPVHPLIQKLGCWFWKAETSFVWVSSLCVESCSKPYPWVHPPFLNLLEISCLFFRRLLWPHSARLRGDCWLVCATLSPEERGGWIGRTGCLTCVKP